MAIYDKVIKIAEREIGYLEKKNLTDLDSKTGNAGSNNYTKYARDVAQTDILNGSKQGYSWCAVFVIWCFLQAYGAELTKKLLYCGSRSLAAGCGRSQAQKYYRDRGRLYGTPLPGDQVFFGESHTGLVASVGTSSFTTIEGNTSGASGVISNGGGVCRKVYPMEGNYSFGRPDWALLGAVEPSEPDDTYVEISVPELSFGATGGAVEAVQRLLNSYGYSCGKCDGIWGEKTDTAMLLYQRAKGLDADKICGRQTWGRLLGAQ